MQQNLKMFVLSRGDEIQLKVGEGYVYVNWRFNGYQ